MKENAALTEIYNNLLNGYVYGYAMNNVRFPYFHNCLWYGTRQRNIKYFFWNNFGSSANRANKKELKWLIETIFRCTPEEFINKYEMKTWDEINHYGEA